MKSQTSKSPTDKIKRLAECAFTEAELTPNIQSKFGYPKGWRIQAFCNRTGELVIIGFMISVDGKPDGKAKLCMFTNDPTKVDVGVSPKSFGQMKMEIANTLLVI